MTLFGSSLLSAVKVKVKVDEDNDSDCDFEEVFGLYINEDKESRRRVVEKITIDSFEASITS